MNVHTPENKSLFIETLLQWADSFDTFCLLNSNNYSQTYGSYPFILGVGKISELESSFINAFDKLKQYNQHKRKKIFGLIGYDVKNDIENLHSNNSDYLEFPDLYFFEPEHIIELKENKFLIHSDTKNLLEIILQHVPKKELLIKKEKHSITFKSRISKENYLKKIQEIQEHILKGNIYELNFCQEFYAENSLINPIEVYLDLNKLSPTPFSSLFKIKDKYILCASPERFLRKEENKIISQPIKGTIYRSNDPKEDELLKEELQQNPKERSENVMIVDLVRNDLTRSAMTGSIKVEELFGIYSFAHLHHMISTVTAQTREDINGIDIIQNAFPMGSMTGAPKIKAMELIEYFEESKRGAYSGTIGYIDEQDNFDFNVVIRSVFYRNDTKYLSFQVGSAITYDSVGEKEYEECLLKAKAIIQVFK